MTVPEVRQGGQSVWLIPESRTHWPIKTSWVLAVTPQKVTPPFSQTCTHTRRGMSTPAFFLIWSLAPNSWLDEVCFHLATGLLCMDFGVLMSFLDGLFGLHLWFLQPSVTPDRDVWLYPMPRILQPCQLMDQCGLASPDRGLVLEGWSCVCRTINNLYIAVQLILRLLLSHLRSWWIFRSTLIGRGKQICSFSG